MCQFLPLPVPTKHPPRGIERVAQPLFLRGHEHAAYRLASLVRFTGLGLTTLRSGTPNSVDAVSLLRAFDPPRQGVGPVRLDRVAPPADLQPIRTGREFTQIDHLDVVDPAGA